MVDGPATVIRLAGTEAVNCDALPYVVDSAWVFQYTTAPEANPLPFTVNVNAGPPATTGNGLSEEIAGPWAMVKFTLPEVTPPETTVTVAVPCDAIRLADTAAVNCVALTYVVDSDVPFHFTTAPEANPLPFTVSVKADPPAVALEGLSEVIAGGGLMVNVAPPEVTPPETTVMVAVPCDAIRLADTDAVNCVALTYVVDSADPFQSTTAPEAKPLPFTVSVNAAPPTVALEGLNELIAGGLLTVMGNPVAAEVYPPEIAKTENEPAVAIRLAGTDAVTCVALTYVVVSVVELLGVVYQSTEAPDENPVPFTVRMNAGPPAVTLDGLNEVIEGMTGRLEPADVTPPEVTVMVAGPATVIKLAGTVAVNCVALTYVVVNAVPFHFTTAPEANPLPFTVNVKAGPPATTGSGLSELIAGGGLMVNVAPLEVKPLETTVTVGVPCDAIRLADTEAVNCVALTYVVGSAVPFQSTTAPEANPLPFTVSVKADPPAVALDGLSEVIDGTPIVNGSVIKT